ncbi:uncharacterized protein MYCFIDRAFT_78096 [Pseudocercospora fijiensis CIRAD86]|uniref:Uncharacterized protein n=1 Tax=Pseudocercospora fijiensis (strain CIRAD86) TaxID=383855 RepID=M3AT95_PSEFD|nr:uncharacterized protein MYCFIDRAFT_78096 [Pseudocercospora fijiensis CIRAD86]EME80353.1 hypothetical protein MYCFIDRAFT_78096 [Pseudocercospora fijiensis CIRAD86]
MSTLRLRVLVLAHHHHHHHHHGTWRIVRVDTLQLSNAASAIQSSPPAGTRCITTPPHSGSTLASPRTPAEMGFISLFTKGPKKGTELNATCPRCETAVELAPPFPEQSLPGSRAPTAPRIVSPSYPSKRASQLASGLADDSSDRDDKSEQQDSFRRPKGVRLTKVLSMNPKLSLEERRDRHHTIPKPVSGLAPLGTPDGRTGEPPPGPRLRDLSNFPYLRKQAQATTARRERTWADIEKQASELGKKAENHAFSLDGGQDQIEGIQSLCDDFNDVYDYFGSLIAELDDMIDQHGVSTRQSSNGKSFQKPHPSPEFPDLNEPSPLES